MNREHSDYYYYSKEPSKRIPVSHWTSLQGSQGGYPHAPSSYTYYQSQEHDSARSFSNSHQHGNCTSQQPPPPPLPQQWTGSTGPIPTHTSGMTSSRRHHHHMSQQPSSSHSLGNAVSTSTSYSRTSSSSTSSSSSSTASHVHDVRALPTISENEVQKWLEGYTFGDKLYWRCRWEGCTDPLLPRGPQAYDHVARHLAVKQYECTTCNKTFATKATASRHLNTQEKTFPCQYCGNYFARKDYRNTHEKKCQLAPLT